MHITIIKYWIIYYAKQHKITNYALNSLQLQFNLSIHIYIQKKDTPTRGASIVKKVQRRYIFYSRGELGYIKSVLLKLVCCNASPIFCYNKN